MAQKKRKRSPDSAAHTLDAIETRGDRLVEWISDNPAQILGAAVAILLVAGIWGLTRDSMDSTASESATALAQVQGDYRSAMGATPGSIEIPEPANPATARDIRTEYVAAYETVATDHAGTTAASIALLEAGKLQQQLGETDAAAETFQRGIDATDAADPVRALLLTRLASVHEAAGRYEEAASTYEQAADVPGYPLRFDALANAARVFAQAGNGERALAAFDRIESEAPDFRVAPYVEARLDELRAGSPN